MPENVLEHQPGINGAGNIMRHLRETFAWCRAGARRMCHTPGKLEEHMFITGSVKDRVEMSGPHTGCLTTPAGSCAMLHFDSMVITLRSSKSLFLLLPPNLCLSVSVHVCLHVCVIRVCAYTCAVIAPVRANSNSDCSLHTFSAHLQYGSLGQEDLVLSAA